MATKSAKKPALEFIKSAKSPFPDGYDIEAEEAVVRHLIDADNPDPSDPLYPRFALFEERTRALRQMRAEHTLRQQANKEVSLGEAANIQELGQLVQDGEDEMLIHTLDAMRLFLGVDAVPGTGGHPVAGAKKIAADLRLIWFLSENDNPYADWCLIELGEKAAEFRRIMEAEQSKVLKTMEQMKEKGLSYSIVKSTAPVVTHLGFRSPYGYTLASLVVEFDYCNRVLKSAQKRDLLTGAEVHQKLRSLKRFIRAVFERVAYCRKYLCREEMKALCRSDFLPGADEEAQKRRKAAIQIFGECPRDVFNGDKQPRHTRRHVELSDAEYRMLNEVPLSGDESAPAGLI